MEKIELPRATSRKSFLGKLGNKKSRAPPRPSSSVKRTKSITDSGGELHAKKIDPSDISGPVVRFFSGVRGGRHMMGVDLGLEKWFFVKTV